MCICLGLSIWFWKEFKAIEDLFKKSKFFALDFPEYPTIVLCNSNQIRSTFEMTFDMIVIFISFRKSYIAKIVTNDVMDLLSEFPTNWDDFTDKLTSLDSLNSTAFFVGAAQLAKNFIAGYITKKLLDDCLYRSIQINVLGVNSRTEHHAPMQILSSKSQISASVMR